MSKKTFEYVILVRNKSIAKGKDLRKMWEDAKRKYPAEKIVIRWEPPERVIIAIPQVQKTRIFRLPVGIASYNNVPPILGRVQG